MEREGTAEYDIDFGGQDNDHAEESKEEKEETRKIALPKKTKSASVVDSNVVRDITLREIKKGILQRQVTEAIVMRKV